MNCSEGVADEWDARDAGEDSELGHSGLSRSCLCFCGHLREEMVEMVEVGRRERRGRDAKIKHASNVGM